MWERTAAAARVHVDDVDGEEAASVAEEETVSVQRCHNAEYMRAHSPDDNPRDDEARFYSIPPRRRLPDARLLGNVPARLLLLGSTA